MAQSKATKKFEKNRLHDTIKRRKEFAKVKQRHQVNAKKKAKRRSQQNGAHEDADPEKEAGAKKPTKDKSQASLEDMTMDDFFAGGFDALKDMPKGAARQRGGKRKRTQDGDVSDDASVESVEDRAAADMSDDLDSEDDELKTHKNELKALSEKDPEFYKHLLEEDPELLDFDDSNLPEIDELSEGEDQETSGKRGKKDKSEPSNDVTTAMVKRWSNAMRDRQSLRAMRECVLAFRAASHINEENGKEYKYTISNADVYHELVVCTLKQVPEVLNHHMPVKKLAHGREHVPTDNKQFRTLTNLLKSHTGSILFLLDNLSDAATMKAALASILALVPYLLSFKKLIKSLTRSVVEIWAEPSQHETTRISAYLILRDLTRLGDAGIKDTVLRTTYQGLLKGSRNTTIHNIAAINLMKNSALELWGLPNETTSVPYTTAFTFIRALAIHLRTSIKHNANESYKAVYNWQYVHALDFWSRCLAHHCAPAHEALRGAPSPLRPLIYPLVQLSLGAMRLIPSAAFFPLRFHCTRALLRISASTGTFIPLAAPLLEVLQAAEMRRAPKASTQRPLDFDVALRAPAGLLRTRVFQDGVADQVVELLGDFFALWCRSIAMPELWLPAGVMLRRWLKEVSPHQGRGQQHGRGAPAGGNRNAKVNGAVLLLVQKLDANARFVEARRAKVEFSPRDRAGVEGFLKEVEWNKTPLGAYVEGQRKQREERRRVLEESRREEERKREKGRGKRMEDEEDEDEDEDDGDEDGMEMEFEDEDEDGESELEEDD